MLWNAGELRHELLIDSVANNAGHKIGMEKHPDMATRSRTANVCGSRRQIGMIARC